MRWIGRWFWAPIRAGENSAQTIVRVLGNVIRSTFTVFVLVVAALMLVLWYSDMQHKSKRAKAEAEAGLVTVDARIFKNGEAYELRNLLVAEHKLAKDGDDPEKTESLRKEIFDLLTGDDTFFVQCSEHFPLALRVENRSDRAVQSVKIDLTGRNKGSSVNELNYTDSYVDWSNYVPPHRSLVRCFSISDDNQNLIFSANYARYNLVLVDPEDWMNEESSAWKIND
tara:strand:+ start:161 stop:838 length:678 start_codon:yes stop_codon:yes gene_type:complete